MDEDENEIELPVSEHDGSPVCKSGELSFEPTIFADTALGQEVYLAYIARPQRRS